MREYRRRFIRLNMALVGAVLLLALIAIGAYMGKNEYDAMRRTMEETLEPFRGENGSFAFTPRGRGTLKPDDDGADAARAGGRKAGEAPRGDAGGRCATVFYEDGVATLISGAEGRDEETLLAAAAEAAERSDDFGRIESGKMYYYKTGTESSLRISLYPASYLSSAVLRTCAYLIVAFVSVMAACYVISRYLSKLAVRPVERAMEREKQFVADISHDLKTPLAVVKSCQRILAEDETKTVGEGRQWLEKSSGAVGDMEKLIDDMLTLSAVESGAREPVRETIDLSALAEKAALQMEATAYERGIDLETEIAGGVTVTGDPDALLKAASGLIENAIKYEPEDGKVAVSLEKNGRKAAFSVRNFNSVIPEEDLPHVFERFYRGDKARSARAGHGLGLAIIKGAVENMGGAVSVKSGKGTGTVFTITLG